MLVNKDITQDLLLIAFFRLEMESMNTIEPTK